MNQAKYTQKTTAVTSINMKDLIHRVLAGSVILRDVQVHHVKSIREYIVENFENQSIYLPSIVVHVNKGKIDQWLHGDITVIDGSHRIEACMQLHEKAKTAVNDPNEEVAQKAQDFLLHFHGTQLPLQLYQGLTKEERDQLYLDINSRGK